MGSCVGKKDFAGSNYAGQFSSICGKSYLHFGGDFVRKKSQLPGYDPLTENISNLLERIPVAKRLYMWKPMLFNFMIVGASGMILSWIIYEGFLRSILVNFLGGTFFGMLITTFLVFLWNYTWNKNWSLGIHSQIMHMKKYELQELHERIKVLLKQKFDHKGERI